MSKHTKLWEEYLYVIKEINVSGHTEVDMSSFIVKDSFNPKIWEDNKLNDAIRQRLITIAEDFYGDLEIPEAEIDDIIFTGSLANYNWSQYSDIDLHILVDFSKVDENVELVREYFNAIRALWNLKHNILVKGFEVELYIQDINEEHHSTGVYSIKNDEWLAEPVKIKPEISFKSVEKKAKALMDQIDQVEKAYSLKKYDFAKKFGEKTKKKIKNFRSSGLEKAGEYSEENLAFKILRRNGYMKKLSDAVKDSYDKMMSLGDNFGKKWQIFLRKGQNNTQRLEEMGKFQKMVRKKHPEELKWLLDGGNQSNSSPFKEKRPKKSMGSAPPGAAGG